MERNRRSPMIRANILTAIVAELARRQLPVEALLRTHLESDRIGSLYDEIPLPRYLAFFEAAATLANDPALGARVGLYMQPEEMGPLGIIFTASPNVRTALDRLSFFLRAWQGGTVIELETRATTAEWTYQIDDPSIQPRRQDAEFSVAVTCSLIRAMLGQSWAPLEVHFEHSASEAPGHSRTTLPRLLAAPVQFNQSVNRVIFDRTDLGRLVFRPQQSIAPYLEQHLRDLMSLDHEERGFSARVALLIAKRMGQRTLTVQSLANELGISPRTLQRRLAEDGTSLREIVRSERARIAEALLRTRHRQIGAIAHDLGYTDTAVFSRAFKSWTGNNPRSFRRSTAE